MLFSTQNLCHEIADKVSFRQNYKSAGKTYTLRSVNKLRTVVYKIIHMLKHIKLVLDILMLPLALSKIFYC